MFIKGEINSKTSKHKLITIIELILIISKTADNSRAMPTDIIKRLIKKDEFFDNEDIPGSSDGICGNSPKTI